MPRAAIIKNYQSGEVYKALFAEDIVDESGTRVPIMDVLDDVNTSLDEKGVLPLGEFAVIRTVHDLSPEDKAELNHNSVLNG